MVFSPPHTRGGPRDNRDAVNADAWEIGIPDNVPAGVQRRGSRRSQHELRSGAEHLPQRDFWTTLAPHLGGGRKGIRIRQQPVVSGYAVIRQQRPVLPLARG